MSWFKETLATNLRIKQMETLLSLIKELEKTNLEQLKADLEEVAKSYNELLKATMEIEETWKRINTLKQLDGTPLH